MTVVEDGCHGIERQEGDVEGALEQMRRAGAIRTRSHLVLATEAERL